MPHKRYITKDPIAAIRLLIGIIAGILGIGSALALLGM